MQMQVSLQSTFFCLSQLKVEIHSIRTICFCTHENVYSSNYKLKAYAKRWVLQMYAKNADER